MKKIIQLATPATPVFAVFKSKEADLATLVKDDISLSECPVMALVEDEDGFKIVQGLINDSGAYCPPYGREFVGFASSEADAIKRYVKK
jgi:hypothetical protein